MSPPRPRFRFDRRTALGIALAAAAAGLVLAVTRPHPQVAILVAEGPLPAGVPLESLPIGVRWVADDHGLVAGEDPADLAGWILAAPIADGEPLVPSLLRPPERRLRPDVLALSLDRDRAALGELQAGDRVDVWTAARSDDGTVSARLIAGDVYLVSAGVGGAGLGGAEQVDLLLAVDDALAAAIVAGQAEGDLTLVRVSP